MTLWYGTNMSAKAVLNDYSDAARGYAHLLGMILDGR